MYGYNSDPEIIWIKDINQLNENYTFSNSMIPCIFARYNVVDHTCDRLWKKTLSLNKANEWVAKKLATKKHAKCKIDIEEDKLIDQVTIDLSNVLGTKSNWDRWENQPRKRDCYDQPSIPRTIRDVLTVKSNISMIVKIDSVELDKNIITKKEESMRLTILNISDIYENKTTITLFNCEIADEFQEGKLVELKDAEVNMRTPKDDPYGEKHPDGMKIPKWGSISLYNGEWKKPVKEEINMEEVANHFKELEEATADLDEYNALVEAINSGKITQEQFDNQLGGGVRCGQLHCARRGQDEQFYCGKCDMELCSICRYEHMEGYSISGLKCDEYLIRGSRKQGVLA